MTRLFLLLLMAATAPVMSGQTPEQRKEAIEARVAVVPSKEAVDRKAKSMAKLKQEGVPVMEKLPMIEDSREAKQRTTEEVTQRAVAVFLTALKGEGLEQPVVDKLVQHYGADKFFSPEETAFIQTGEPARQDRINFAWRYECAWVLAWSLGYVDTLNRPEGICDVPALVKVFKGKDTAQLIKEAKLRPLREILDEADLIYRYHWAVTDARIKGQPAPAKLEGGVVKERHYALNWLIGYLQQNWDDVSTDT